jgi:hypothetical protein
VELTPLVPQICRLWLGEKKTKPSSELVQPIMFKRKFVRKRFSVTKESVQVQKFEIMNPWKLFNYFSEVVPRRLNPYTQFRFLMGGLKMACLKIDRTTLDL